MKVYLAGKIAKSDWRHDLVPHLRGEYVDDGADSVDEWRTVPMLFGLEYVGPYFASCDHGCAHGGEHAWIGGGCIGMQTSDGSNLPTRANTALLCRSAIEKCDAFFAWMDGGETAYGTLVEIGMAHALGKPIYLASSWEAPEPEPCDHCKSGDSDPYQAWRCSCAIAPYGFGAISNPELGRQYNPDLWFAYQQARCILNAGDAVAAFQRAAELMREDSQLDKCESPLEELFYKTYLSCSPSGEIRQKLKGLVAQYGVTAGGHAYRLDFAIPGKKIAFEMDGYTYHGKEREHFNRDRRRDLDLKLEGWEVHRFDGDMIRDDVVQVLEIAAKLAEAQ